MNGKTGDFGTPRSPFDRLRANGSFGQQPVEAPQEVVTPVKTGVQRKSNQLILLDSGFRRNDGEWGFSAFYEATNLPSYCPTRKWDPHLLPKEKRFIAIGWLLFQK